MKFIRIFLASSVVEFERERQELAAYVGALNNIYVRRGIYFELMLCEDLSNAMSPERKQEEYNGFIRSSQYFYVLFGTAAGAYTIEEFETALKAFREQGEPKIYTYFMLLPQDRPAQQSVRDFMARVDKELGHYYSTFAHIDSVKLNLILELCRDPLVGGQVKLEDGQATLDGRPLFTMENIPLYGRNEAVQQLLAEKRKLDEEFAVLAALGSSEAVLRMRLEKDVQRRELAGKLHTLELDVLNLFTEVSGKRQLGQRLNWREAKAIELVDAGNYDGALELLRDRLWTEEVHRAEELIDGATERIREYISGKRTLIRTLRSTGITPETEREILEVYEEICALAEKHRIELDTLRDCASFMYSQNRYPEGIRIAERLRSIYASEQDIPEDTIASLLNLTGILYRVSGRYADAEDAYRKALDIRRKRVGEDPSAYEPELAVSINNLASILKRTGQRREAEELYREALGLRRRLAEADPNAYGAGLSMSCNNLGSLLKNTGRSAEAEPLFREALEIRRRLAEMDPGIYKPALAMSCNNLASLLKNTGRRAEAEPLFREALEIRRKLAEANPAAYEPGLSMSYSNLGSLLNVPDHREEAETLFRKALDIRRRLAETNPPAYAPYLATSCNNLASLLRDTGRREEAIPLLREAFEIRRKLAEADPAVFMKKLVKSTDNLADLLVVLGRHEDASALRRETQEILDRYPQLPQEAQ